MYVTFIHSENLSNDITTFWFKPDKLVDYQAGQFIELTLPHKEVDTRGQKRWFTLSSSPTEKLLSITTKRTDIRPSSFKRELFGIKPGAQVSISEPMGDYVLPIDITIPLLFVVGGIGATPVRSIVQSLIDTGQNRQIDIIYSGKTTEELVYLQVFKQYGVKPKIIISGSDANKDSHAGHIKVSDVMGKSKEQPDGLIYISGPEPMVEVIEAGVIDAGVSPSRLVLDFFPGYPAI